jgi:leader peptidase (prepilin peptidase)/N-methyltransferase
MAVLAWQLPLAALLAALGLLASGLTPRALAVLYLAAVTPELARVDIREQRLPNRLVLPGIAVAIIALAGDWLVTGLPPLVPLIAGGGSFAVFLALAAAGGVGMGDVKLAALLGLSSSSPAVAVATPMLALLLGGVASIVVLATRGRGARFPFGPFLLAGFWGATALVTAASVGAVPV